MKHITTAQAAQELGLTEGRIRQLARSGVLKGERAGRDWFFLPSVIRQFLEAKKQAKSKRKQRNIRVRHVNTEEAVNNDR